MSNLDDLLSRHFDGQLSPEELTELEGHLAADPALAGVLDAFATNRDLLRAHLDAEVSDLDFEAFTAGVMARVADEVPAAARAVAAEPAPTPAAARAAAASAPRGGGLGARLRRFFVPVLLGAAVAAVATWLIVRPPAAETDEVTGGEVYVDAVSNEGPQTVLISQPVDEGGSTVIWLLEDELDADGAPVAPGVPGAVTPGIAPQPNGDPQGAPLTEDPI